MVRVLVSVKGFVGQRSTEFALELPEASPVAAVLESVRERVDGPWKAQESSDTAAAFVSIVITRNGQYVSLRDAATALLEDEDRIVIFPVAVAG